LIFRRAKNLKLRNIEVNWEKPTFDKWQAALLVENVDGLELDGFTGNSAWPERGIPAVILSHAQNATVRNAQAPPGTNVFLKIVGTNAHDIHLVGNDFHEAKIPYTLDSEVNPENVTALDNFLPPAAR